MVQHVVRTVYAEFETVNIVELVAKGGMGFVEWSVLARSHFLIEPVLFPAT